MISLNKNRGATEYGDTENKITVMLVEDIKNLVEDLTPAERIAFFKELVDNMDIIITGSYGAYDYMSSDTIRVADLNDMKYFVGCTEDSVIVATNIMTG